MEANMANYNFYGSHLRCCTEGMNLKGNWMKSLLSLDITSRNRRSWTPLAYALFLTLRQQKLGCPNSLNASMSIFRASQHLGISRSYNTDNCWDSITVRSTWEPELTNKHTRSFLAFSNSVQNVLLFGSGTLPFALRWTDTNFSKFFLSNWVPVQWKVCSWRRKLSAEWSWSSKHSHTKPGLITRLFTSIDRDNVNRYLTTLWNRLHRFPQLLTIIKPLNYFQM